MTFLLFTLTYWAPCFPTLPAVWFGIRRDCKEGSFELFLVYLCFIQFSLLICC
ncbi:hypothetical protein K474DRAFT_617324 [Panus rudis PR-1116 ss-1]|nr:hypothetical protein K474DRAFT_617324 [Panus rudis PR-1116 ss-1]